MTKRRLYILGGFLLTTVLTIAFGAPALLSYLETREPVDITGEWQLEFSIKDSTYQPYIGTKSNYKIYFIQKDQNVNGNGESWELNAPLNYSAHRPLTFNGKIIWHNLDCNYILYGELRTTTGHIRVIVDDDWKSMSGDFSGNAANANGTIRWYRLR